MAASIDSMQGFWRWFANHQAEFKAMSNADDPFWDVAFREFQKVDERHWVEVSDPCGAEREFIVTAYGRVEAFGVVERLVERAPAVDGWVFVALKPAMGFTFTTMYEGKLFEPAQMWFLPLESASHPQDLGLRIGIPGLELADKEKAHNAVLVILDTALGELAAAVDVQYVEVSELPMEPESHGYIELPEPAEYMAWRK